MVLKDFDGVFEHIGGFGRYQMFLFAVNCYMSAMMGFVYLGQIFMSITPPHWCRPPPDIDLLDLTPDEVKQLTIPFDAETMEYSKCTRYDVGVSEVLQRNISKAQNITSWNITTCNYGWTYDYSLYYPTITSELNWVCDEDWKPAFSQSLFFVGCLVGVPILGWAADKWGRLPIIVATNVVCGVFGIASAFSGSFVTYSVLRFIVGMTYDTNFTVAYILVMEYVSSNYRTIMGNVPIMVFLTASMCSLPWIGYFLRHWTYYTIAIHVPQLLCIVFIWTLPESARWLLAQGRFEATEKIIKTAAKVNGKKLSSEFLKDFKEFGDKQAAEKTTTAGIFDLMKTPALRLRFLLLCVMWVTIMLAYDGHMRNSENIGFNVFVSFTVLGFTELPADFITIILMEVVGRRHTTVWTLVLSGIVSLVITCIPSGYPTTIFGLAIAGRFLITMSINVGQQYIIEVLPTVARSSGTSAIHTLGSASAFVSPYIIYLTKFGAYLPYLILGVVTVVGGAICALLPETLNESLPDSLEDGETYYTDQGCCYNPCAARKKMKVTPISDSTKGTKV